MDFLQFLLFVYIVIWLRRMERIRWAKRQSNRTRDELNLWISDHPDTSLWWPQAQDLLRMRIKAWEEYTRVCPAVRDNGLVLKELTRFIRCSPDTPTPGMMP